MTKKFKAYEVREGDEGHCCIVFASSNAAARRDGASELNTEWEGVESCRRAPGFDQFSPGPVPLAALVAAGWWHECQHCGFTFDADGRHGDGENDRNDQCDPVEREHGNYCSETCAQSHWAERQDRAAHENATIEAAAIRWPGVTSIRAWRGGQPEVWHAQFSVPGLQYPADWVPGDASVMVSQIDVDAFTAWRDANGLKKVASP